ncbi:haloacid dehalogenase [Dictyobacter alpinus]|uniref:Haloacid dehalogenase n=1 Tax=Dictyobacter alpinus TaxID=2014873 RepID=A0A402BJQ8_9CHLR|nr:Cof-type HAD-IIB family hydrolase [Dictyobacter alpinus]GCE31591.1 haloacid dehalogenase [Dictyobacter alpinus]
MYRLLAIDLDGTLLTPQHKVSPYTLEVLQRAVADGMRLVIATGRVPFSFHKVISGLPLNAPQITSNGAVVIDMNTNTILYQQLVPPDYILPVIEYARRLDLVFCYYTNDYLYTEHELYNRHNWYLSGIPVRDVEKIEDVYPQPCIKIGAFGDAATLIAKRRELERAFVGKLYVTQTAGQWLEFLHPAVSKANALRTITQMLDIRPEEVIAFGDNHNDIDMLRFAGLGIAMGNAHQEVKAVADYVTLRNIDDGVAVALEKFLFAIEKR